MARIKLPIDWQYVQDTYLYDPETGVVSFKVNKGRSKAGAVVGYVSLLKGMKYLATKVRGKHVLLHRLAFFYVNGFWPNEIDHINGGTIDNRIRNLREVFGNENHKNRKVRADNKHGIHGVVWHKLCKKWYVSISVDMRQQSLGVYDSFFDACCVRKSAERAHNYHANHGASWR